MSLGRLAGLQVTARPSAIVAAVAMAAGLSALAMFGLRLPAGQAIAAGLLAAALHWASEITHQLGHAWAARRTGYPMTGIRFWGPLGASVYPADEPELPARIHIRRALGGPLISLGVTLVAAIVAAALFPLGGLARYLSLFAAIENLAVFCLGSLLPLSFTDGGTLLRWISRGQRTANRSA
jgi:Zn-dependent protease